LRGEGERGCRVPLQLLNKTKFASQLRVLFHSQLRVLFASQSRVLQVRANMLGTAFSIYDGGVNPAKAVRVRARCLPRWLFVAL